MTPSGAITDLPQLPAVGGPPGLPAGSRRRLWLLLAALLTLLLTAVRCAQAGAGTPTSLADARLVGPRGPGCIRLALLADESGSMARYTTPRAAAVEEVLHWAPANLRPDDELAVIDWGGTAAAGLPTTPTARLPAAGLTQPAIDPTGSALTTAVTALAGQPASRCRTLAAVISDGLIAETDPAAMLTSLQHADVDQIRLLRPSPKLPTPDRWTRILPYAPSTAFHGRDPTNTALTFGKLLATATGQHLTRD